MDFFDRQEQAKRNTTKLVVYFGIGVTLLCLAVYAVSLIGYAWLSSRHRFDPGSVTTFWHPQLFLGTTVGTLAVILIGSAFKSMELSQGGSSVATMLGGRLLNAESTDPDERKLLNVVEEMALASGVPVPQVYVMDRETGINAFAAGHSTSDAVIGVTHGCMKLLKRDELQGVIGHEFSHILNGDMRLNLRLMGWIFGIFCISVVGRVLLETRGGSRRDRNPLPLIGLMLLALGWIGVLFGRLIQAAVSRQREFLADASAVQFTRNPDGLAGALKKIGGLAYGSKLESAHASEASHLFFGNGMGESLFGAMDTHPPLEERIRAIDPQFDGKFTYVEVPADDEAVREIISKSKRPPVFPMPGFPQPRGAASIGMLAPAIAASAVMPSLGEPTKAHLRYAVEMRNSFSPAVQEAARNAMGASALVYAMLIGAEPGLREQQLQLLATATSDAMRRETERLLPDISQIATRTKLPLVDLALPGLRQLSPAQYQQFSKTVQQLIESDNQIDLFEYVLQKITLRHLESQFKPARKPIIQYYALKPLATDCAVLLSALAHVGSDDPAHAVAAFQQGAGRLAYYAQSEIGYLAPDACDLSQVDAALDRLNQAVPQIKKNVLNACALTVAADGVIQEMEAELLRGIADALDCPIPPFIAVGN
ncbi:MAG TPA: M48 family metallopeptidase [Candidatus Paceibacterota bacterium]|nr:M48 family metallopeptidase [Candidatus Paceibacterota bacterium]